MASNCIDETLSEENLREGLRILARIIVRDFMANNILDGASTSSEGIAE